MSSLNEHQRLDGAFGIDWLAVSVPVSSFDNSLLSWTSSGRKVNLKSGIQVSITTAPGGGYRARIEFNPSRFLGLDGGELATVTEAVAALHIAWPSIRTVINATANINEAEIQRVDVTRHFELTSNVSTVLEKLRTVNPAYARKKSAYMSKKGDFETLYVGNNNRRVCAYDLAAKHTGVVGNILRWELRLRRGYLRRKGMATIADMTTMRCAELAAELFVWSGMGADFQAVGERLIETSRAFEDREGKPWGPTRQRTFIGYFYMESYGYDAEVSKAPLAEYRRLMRKHGLGLSRNGFQPESITTTRRLDFWAGREVIDDLGGERRAS